MKGRLGPSFIDKEDASSILHGNQRAGSFSVPCLPTLSEESRAQFIHCCTSTVIITSGYLHRGARARTQQLERGMWDLSSPPRDQTLTPPLEGDIQITGPTGKSCFSFILKEAANSHPASMSDKPKV